VGDAPAGRQRYGQGAGEGVHTTLEELARAKGVHATYVSRVLRVTQSPETVVAILDYFCSGVAPVSNRVIFPSFRV
jgi:hypothetical protein